MFVANQPVLILTSSVCCKRGWRWRSLSYTCYMLTRGSARKPKLDSELLASRTTKVNKNNWFVAECFHVLFKTHRVEPLFSVPMWPLWRGWTVFDDFVSHRNTVRNIQCSHTRLRESMYLGFFCFASDCLSCSWWDMKGFLSKEQISDNVKFTIKIEQPSSARLVCNVMCQIQQINLSDKGNQLKQPKDPFTITS